MSDAHTITQEFLKSLFSYDLDTGTFTRIISKGAAPYGKLVGSDNGRGYLRCSIHRKQYMLHRLAWLYVTGAWPENVIDHIDGDTKNNRFSNLRDVSHSVNMQNQRKAHNRNNLRLLGVQVDGNRFSARIMVNGKPIYAGSFKTPEEAHQAYLAVKRRHHSGNTI